MSHDQANGEPERGAPEAMTETMRKMDNEPAATTAQAPTMGAGQDKNNLENIKVAVRLRPFTEKERQRSSKRIVDIEQNTVALYSPKAPNEIKKFTFDYSYWSHDGFRRNQEGVNVPDPGHPNSAKYVGQECVFEDLGRFLLENALQGYNSALLAYGQTGSGKSYTVSGYGQNEGILPRFARELFSELERRLEQATEQVREVKKGVAQEENETAIPPAAKDQPPKVKSPVKKKKKNRFEVYFSMIEIYNEVVRDLLAKQTSQMGTAGGGNSNLGAGPAARRGLRVREHPKRGFFVESLTSIECANKDEIERLIEEGQLNKSIAATSMNETSSRGHTIYEFHIRQYRSRRAMEASEPAADSVGTENATPIGAQAQQPEVDTLTTSVVQLVDLAGSERMAVHMVTSTSGLPLAADNSGGRSGSPFPAAGTSGRSVVASEAPKTPARRRMQPSSAASSSSSSTATITASSSKQTASLRRITPQQQANLSPLNLMTGNHQQRFKESVSINQSLSALGNCIQVLSQFSQQQLNGTGSESTTGTSKQPKIPYRDSVLTKLLNRCCLSGNSKVVLIATLSPAESNYDDTLSTLRFADRAKQIRTHALINRSQRSGGEAVNALQRENERLKQILDGRVTRSDDSSQTSNFDDTENMLDNFNGPRADESRAAKQGAPTTGSTTATFTRGRVAPGGHSSRNATGAQVRSRSTVRSIGQDKSTPTSKTPGTPRKIAGGRGSRKQNTSNAIDSPAPSGNQAAGNLKVSASNPSLAGAGGGVAPSIDREQMKQLVSPGKRKMRQNTQTLGTSATSGEREEQQHKLRKSRSLGQGLAQSRKQQPPVAPSPPAPGADQRLMAREIELASSLLDEIDLNELASIIDDENLLSGADSSDDSLSGRPTSRQLLEEGGGHLSNEEKMNILNKILNSNNSNKSTQAIKQKLEENLAAAAAAAAAASTSSAGETTGGEQGPQAAMERPSRPRKATGGAKPKPQQRHQQPASEREGSGLKRASQLKRTNPYLSNLNPDEQLTGMITYIIKPGEMIVGKSANCDLLIYGPGLRGQHARLVRTPEVGEVFVEPIFAATRDEEKPKRVALMANGEPVLERTKITHGDRLLFGSTNYFVFIDHNHATTVQQQQQQQQQVAGSDLSSRATTDASLDMVTYEMAHQEVLRKIMSDAENEAMIREINDYTHRPGTGKHRPTGRDTGGDTPTKTQEPAIADSSRHKMSGGSSSRLTRSMTIHDNDPSADSVSPLPVLVAAQTVTISDVTSGDCEPAAHQLDKIKEADEQQMGPEEGHTQQEEAEAEEDEQYRDKLVEDTYEFAMPIREANAIAKEMGIKVTYGMKILSGEEQMLLNSSNGNDDDDDGPTQDYDEQPQVDVSPYQSGRVSEDTPPLVTNTIKPATLDMAPEMYVHVHLDEFEGVDFYWSKEKFYERRVKMLELYGAWDVGGKSGLVEYLIEQSKYQGYYMIDPFIDDLRSSFVLIGHAQVTLQPLGHMSHLPPDNYDIHDVNDEVVGQVRVAASPCHADESQEEMADVPAYRKLSEQELAKSYLERSADLLGKRLVLQLHIVSCSQVPHRFARVFCQYTLNREQPVVRTRLARITSAGGARASQTADSIQFDHQHFVVIDEVTPDLLDFFQDGFLTIQLVGQYDLKQIQIRPSPPVDSATAQNTTTQAASPKVQSAGGSVQSGGSSSSSVAHPTLISTIISSINKYRFRMEQQSAMQGAALVSGGSYASGPVGGNQADGQYQTYASSLTGSAQSGGGGGPPGFRGTGGGGGILNSNSGASSVTSASATINLFDQQQDDEDRGSGSINGTSQENIIDMILTKRKLDRAENQLHYIKRTINLAEHYNKRHIPVRTVKKLLNSYGHDLENGSLEEMAAEVTIDETSKSAPGKSSGCVIQ